MLIDTTGDGVVGTFEYNVYQYDEYNVNWYTSVASDDDSTSEGAQRLNCSNGAVATLLDEPKVSLLIKQEEALADDELINYRVVDEAVVIVSNNDDVDDIKN